MSEEYGAPSRYVPICPGPSHIGQDFTSVTSPFDRAASWQGEVRWIHDERALDALLAEPAGSGWRVICKKGIRLDSVFYIAGPLGSRVGERVKLRRDPTDRGRIHVYLEDGSFLCVAEYPRLSGGDHNALAAAMKIDFRKDRKEIRARARDVIRRTDPDGVAARVLARKAKEAAQVVALPRKGRAHQTPALTQAGLAAQAAGKTSSTSEHGVDVVDKLGLAAARFLKDEEWA